MKRVNNIKAIIVLMTAVLVFSLMPVTVMATDNSVVNNNVVSNQKDNYHTNIWVDDNDFKNPFIIWNASTDFVLYSGEKMYVDYTIRDTYSDCYTTPLYNVFNSEYIEDPVFTYDPLDPSMVVSTSRGYSSWYGYHDIDSDNLESGDYFIAISAMPCEATGRWISNYSSVTIPTRHIWFTIKKLPKPSSLSVKGASKKATLTWKKVIPADKYQVYRSKKKSSGYKKVATVTSCKYVNKSLKKGTYYYKVRAVRGNSETGIAYSNYTSPKKVTVKK